MLLTIIKNAYMAIHFLPYRALTIAISLILGLSLSPTLSIAAEKPAPLELPILDDVKTIIDTTAQKLSRDLTEKASELKNRLITNPVQTYPVENPAVSKVQTFAYKRDIRPILDKKCVACHSCYDAPCQLKMDSHGGLQRGASKTRVYDGSRLTDIPPTRMGIDGQTTRDWREKGFFSVLHAAENDQRAATAPLLQKMLNLGRSNPLPVNRPVAKQAELGIDRKNACPAPGEFAAYATDHPHGGMPYAVAGLNDSEFNTLSTWIGEGGLIKSESPPLTPQQQAFIEKTEAWFNRQDPRAKLVARYLYEHLFLAHIYFKNPVAPGPVPFFRLIRSSSPSGIPALPLPTIRPNDAPKEPFHYRLVPITETIVHKTHITYPLDDAKLADFEQLFLGSDWSIGSLPDYSTESRSNPFVTFRAIPAKARYRFLLNDAEFFVRTFIRGPVCNGQIATAVIRDQFWVMFEDPEHEHYVNDAQYRPRVDPLLGVPGLNSSLSAMGSEWLTYQEKRNAYLDKREKAYRAQHPTGPELAHVWQGDGTNGNAYLSVFRHHTSASVVRGWQGAQPLTAWLMDYPLLERTYYELVVGFNVFGSVSHQAQTRLYFDLIRNESETNFLRLLPATSRKAIYDDWYQASGQLKTLVVYHDLDVRSPSQIPFTSDDPKRELLENFVSRHPDLARPTCTTECGLAEADVTNKRIISALHRLTDTSTGQAPGLRRLPEVTFLRVNIGDGDYRVFSLLRNRRHSNVAFIFGESLRYQEELDSLTLMPQLIGSYPNLIFQVDLPEIGRFAEALASAGSDKDFAGLVGRWGVLRMAPDFWDVFHSFSDHMRRYNPVEAGLYDLNRYEAW